MKEISSFSFFKIYQTKSDFRIIDVRDPHEFDSNHIAGAINIPMSLLIDKHFLFINKRHHYYVMCKNGSRSYSACKYLTELGYDVTNIVGGLDRWPGSVTKSRNAFFG